MPCKFVNAAVIGVALNPDMAASCVAVSLSILAREKLSYTLTGPMVMPLSSVFLDPSPNKG